MTRPHGARGALALGVLAGPLPVALALAGFVGIRAEIANAGSLVLLAGALAAVFSVPAIIAGRVGASEDEQAPGGGREAKLGRAFGLLGLALVLGTVVWVTLIGIALSRAL